VSLRANLSATVAAQTWVALIQLVVLPVYLNGLGVEGYALLNFSMTVVLTAQLFDFGLGQTVTRELARRSANERETSRGLLATVTRLYVVLAIAASLVFLVLAPVLVRHVITVTELTLTTVQHALTLIAGLIAINFFVNLYQSCLMGLERISIVSGIRALAATASAMGGALLVMSFSGSVTSLLIWNICVAAGAGVALKAILQRILPATGVAPSFDNQLIKRLWRFSIGVAGIAVASTVVSQLDRWLLIGLLTLKDFGYYVLAASVANAVSLIVGPLFGVLFPRLSSLAFHRDEAGLIRTYRASTQLLVGTIVPLAVVLSVFSGEVLIAWTGNLDASAQAGPVLSILVIGSALNGLMNIPYAMHLAYGRTRLILAINVAGIAVLVPLVLVLTPIYGPQGAATGWLAFNIVFACIAVYLTHRTLRGYSAMRWLVNDIAPGAIAALIFVGAAKYALPSAMSRASLAMYLGSVFFLAACLASLSEREVRGWIFHYVRRYGWARS
jgi:O-antigen/teichoic acid export membrane protein